MSRHMAPEELLLDYASGALAQGPALAVALHVALDPTARRAVGQLELLPLCQEMIVTGAWWDHVDAVSHRVGAMLLSHRPALLPMIRDWSIDPDRWLRRTSIICQLGFKDRTDAALLKEVIAPNLADPDFFIRKAIGWALREYARTDPDWVRRFVSAHEGSLRALSRREAMKHLN